MHKIFIDATDRHEKRVTLYEGKKILGEKSGDIDIVESIQELLKEKNLNILKVLFDFNEGPGSFTGLKISSTVSNVLNWSSGKAKISNLKYPVYGAEPNIHKTKWLEK